MAVFSTALDTPAMQDFVAGYRLHYGVTPTQRSFFVYEAVYWVVDAIHRAGTDTPAAIEAALKTSTMPSLLGGSYAHRRAQPPAHADPGGRAAQRPAGRDRDGVISA